MTLSTTMGGLDQSQFVGRFAYERLQERSASSSVNNATNSFFAERCQPILELSSQTGRILAEKGCLLYLRGYLIALDRVPLQGEDMARFVLNRYLTADLSSITDAEGSFTFVLCDTDRKRMLVYRNIGDPHYTYYCESAKGIFVGGRPSAVARAAEVSPHPRPDALPTYFLYRSVPGRKTLYEKIQRLLPGELLECSVDGYSIRQLQTLGSYDEVPPFDGDVVGHIDEAFRSVIASCAALDPNASVLLSGGVDSSYIQSHWNQAERKPFDRISAARARKYEV